MGRQSRAWDLAGFLCGINSGMLGLMACLLDRVSIASFWSALFGALVASITSWLASWFIGPRRRVEVMATHQRSDRRP
jgi:putative membrane protein